MTKAYDGTATMYDLMGQRVELSPTTDAWMMGDRYGEVIKIGRKYVHVKMDRSGKVRKLSADLLTVI